MSDLHALVVSR